MKSKMSHLTMLAAMLSLQTDNINSKRSYKPQPIKPLPLKGTLFIIHGVEIYALNQKNAIRKYNNLIDEL
jgi:hypothetical protein